MKKSIVMAALVLGCTIPVFAKPSFFPATDSLNLRKLSPKSPGIDVDFSGKWLGRCDGDAGNSEFVIQQSADSLNMVFGTEKIKFMFNGVTSSDRFNQDVVYQEKYIAAWDGLNHNLRLKMLHWGHGFNGFELTLSQLILQIDNKRLYIQNTHNALFSGLEDFQSGKTNCVYDRVG